MTKKLKAIDLYSGIGGWTLGLKMAGIDIIRSYEWWPVANDTHNKNFGTDTPEIDIRKLNLAELPEGIHFVVGSPPCTQFSYANRGGGGDIADGLLDIAAFLDVVQHYKDQGTLKYWAMENVPRVSGILDRELQEGGQLERYAQLVRVNEVINSADYGLPQRRKRMIAGDFPVELMHDYCHKVEAPTLGQVIESLKADELVDINYGLKIHRDNLSDHDEEPPLTEEERMINQSQKNFHPVYNNMNFPEQMDTPARTMTATCTRVSRESVIIPNGEGNYRRLTVRERATLQGFPITFQFYGKSYSNRVKMIGNAIPPVLTYYIGSAFLERNQNEVDHSSKVKYKHDLPMAKPLPVSPEGARQKYPSRRSFRFAIDNLRFGSGVRFQLENVFENDQVAWLARYNYGSSKNTREIKLNNTLLQSMDRLVSIKGVEAILNEIKSKFTGLNPQLVQDVWTHRKEGLSPFEIVTFLGITAARIHKAVVVEMRDEDIANLVMENHDFQFAKNENSFKVDKYKDNAAWILSGMLTCATFNDTQT